MSGDPGPAYKQQRGFPSGSGLSSSSDSVSAVDHSFSSNSSTSTTSGFASGSEGSGSGFQQRLVGAGLGVSREQGVRDLRSIIQ